MRHRLSLFAGGALSPAGRSAELGRQLTPGARAADEEIAGVDVFLPVTLNDGNETIDAVSHVDGLDREQHANCIREQQHQLLQCRDELDDVLR